MIPGEYDGIGIVKAMREAKVHTPFLFLRHFGSVNERTAGLDAGPMTI